MKPNPSRVALLATLFTALLLVQSANAGLIHRYSFNESADSTTAADSVGGANGELKGTGAFFTGTGQLSLPGGVTSANAAPAGYVDLPNQIINVLENITIESWITWYAMGNWQRIFDFGTSAGGEDVVNGNGNYLFLTPQGPDNLRFAVRDPATGTEPVQLTAGAPLDLNTEICITVTYDHTANVSRMYSNGVLLVTGPASVALSTINDVNNWLGRSQWDDNMFAGDYNEFRIYDTALNPLEVAASYVSGPATPSTDASALGAVQAVHLAVAKTTMTEGDTQQASGSVDFAQWTGMPLAGVPGVTFESDNTGVLTVTQAGTVEAVSPGTANLSVSFQGQSDSALITVNRRLTGVAVAGALYVDLRAGDLAPASFTWPNRVGGASDIFYASLETEPVLEADVAGTGIAGVAFTGTDAYEGPLTTSDLDGGSDASIEVWAFNPAIAGEETLVAWGHRGGPDGSNMSFNYGAHGTWGAVGHWGSPDMGWNGTPAAGAWHYLVYTYDGVNTAKVYADGVLKYQETFGAALNTHAGFPIRIGAQGNNAGDAFDYGQSLTGYIAMVRVHGGELSAGDVANNFLYGIELTDPGELQGITLNLSATTLVGPRAAGSATVTANYANRDYLQVTEASTFESSDPSVLTVGAAGAYVAVKVGSADITVTYNGQQASQTVQVIAPPSLELKHRYSFSEAVGSTTVADSVGTADGVIKGDGAAFDGAGQLYLPGGVGSATEPPAGYVDLPNHIINPLANVSFEAWVTWQGTGIWERIFDFGTSDGGEDVVNGNGAYLFLSPAGAANLRFAVRDPRTGGEPTQLTAPAPLPTDTEVYVAATYDYTGNQAVLYSNAVQVALGPAAVPLNLINDVNNWLGRSQWNDTMFTGMYNEFRIWEGALSAEHVAAAYAAGPNTVPEVQVEPPSLAIALSGDNVVVSWPADATGFALESTAALGPQANWTPVDTSGAVEAGGQKQLTVAPEGTATFYRMKK